MVIWKDVMMSESSPSILIDMTCPACLANVQVSTGFKGTTIYDQAEVPATIAKDLLCLTIDCTNCDETLFIGGTHPANTTLILYKENENEQFVRIQEE